MEDKIEEIGIDEKGRLYLKPTIKTFPMAYREAMEVHWNNEHGYLHGATPREWSYIDWYHQIIKAAAQQGCSLILSQKEIWVNVPTKLQSQILSEHNA
jgi:hypothetical protein